MIHLPPIPIKRLPHGKDIDLPVYATEDSAGMDLRAACPPDDPITLAPRARMLVPTGFAVAIPRGFEGQVRPRSGLAIKHGLSLPNTPGTIDADYRGELMVPLINHGLEPFTIMRGERIAQLVIAPVLQAEWQEVDSLQASGRGSGGFGSTGKS